MLGGKMVALEDWAQLDTPDMYFTKEYHGVSAALEHDFSRYVLLKWQDNTGTVHLPLVLREIGGQGYFDATNAYGFGGPWVTGSPDVPAFRRYVDAWAKEHRVVATFLQFHPLFDIHPAIADAFGVQKTGESVVWDLQSDDLVGQMAANHRRNWRRAVRAGVEAKITYQPTETESFRRLYEIGMQRLSVRSFYWFPDEYWTRLGQQLGPRSLQVEAVYEGRTIASVWCLLGNNTLHFHLNGATDEGRDLRGTFVAHLAAAQWGQDHGFAIGHLGGGAHEALLDFKQRFDPASARRDFSVATLIHDAAEYQRFSAGLPETNFFPPWRDPELEITALSA